MSSAADRTFEGAIQPAGASPRVAARARWDDDGPIELTVASAPWPPERSIGEAAQDTRDGLHGFLFMAEGLYIYFIFR